jgi:hypothetical protein
MTPELVDKLKAINPMFWADTWPCVGDGWYGILEDLSRRLAKIAPECIAIQVKEKFGSLRIYTGNASVDAHDAVAAAERKSAETCETCGKPGSISTDSYWMSAMCDECRAKDRVARGPAGDGEQ